MVYFMQGLSFHDALMAYAVNQLGATVQSDGSLRIWESDNYLHPLAVVESWCKSHEKLDELQWDRENNQVLNSSSWEIRALHPRYLDAKVEEVFCSAEPWMLSDYIGQCRAEFRKKHPKSRARAFVWLLKDGPLVTFYRNQNKMHTLQIEIISRYLIRQSHDNKTPEVVEEWHGTYDEIADQMNIF